MGFFLSNNYPNRVTQIFWLPFFMFVTYILLLGFHELAHFITAKFLKVKVKEVCSRGFRLFREDNKWKFELENPFVSRSFEGCLFIQCDLIKNESQLIKFRNKSLFISISGPIFSYLAVLCMLYLIFVFTNILALDFALLIAIGLAVIVTVGDIQTAIRYMKDQDFLFNILLETDLISNSYEASLAKDYLQRQMIKSTLTLIGQDLTKKECQSKLLCYHKLLYLALVGEIEKINEELFYYILSQIKVLNYTEKLVRTNVSLYQNSEILIYSILYLKFILGKKDKSQELLEFTIKFASSLNIDDGLENIIDYLIGEKQAISLSEYGRGLGYYKILNKKLIQRVGGTYNEKSSSICR